MGVDQSACPEWADLVRGPGRQERWRQRRRLEPTYRDGYGLLASATHTLGVGWFGPEGEAIEEAFVAPETEGVLRLAIPPPDGRFSLDDLSPLYSLYHLDIPAAENVDGLSAIRPEHDVYLGLVDAQRVPYDGAGEFPSDDDRQPGLVALFDPHDLSRTAPMWSTPAPGDPVMMAGYPHDTDAFPVGALSVGRVLSDDDARAAIEALADAGDEEGSIAYELGVELLVEGRAIPGMSWGAAFDRAGRWIAWFARARPWTRRRL